MDDEVLKILRFLNSRIAACSRESREEVEKIVEQGNVTLSDVVSRYIEIVKNT